MIILFDTNVVLDLLLDREPFSETAAQLFSQVEQGEVVGFISATTVTTIYYLATKTVGALHTGVWINELLELCEIAPVNRIVLEGAVKLKFQDFEDAVLHEAARHINAQAIITRDKAGFKKGNIPIYTPIELIKVLSSHECV